MHKNLPAFILLLLIPFCLPAQDILPDTIWNQYDQSGKKYGWWKKNYPDGTLMYKGFFVDDSPRGTLIRYFENGEKKAIMHFSQDGKSAFSTLYYMNGELAAEGKYEGTNKDSTWKYYSYYTHTLSLVENYNAGIKNGPSMKYYDNGLVAESIDWAKCLLALDAIELSPETIADTLGAVLKYQDDIAALQGRTAELLGEVRAGLAAQ